ncbi:30S ribosomal protein S9 [Kocuria rhizophila]|nr:30S ribosomal protein S9 [Kocuria rhizophila]
MELTSYTSELHRVRGRWRRHVGSAPPYRSRPGRGCRKQAVALACLIPGSGERTVNGRSLEEYFPTSCTSRRRTICSPSSSCRAGYDVIARISGGGPSGQAGALRLGVARAERDRRRAQPSRPQKAGFLHPRRPRHRARRPASRRRARLRSTPSAKRRHPGLGRVSLRGPVPRSSAEARGPGVFASWAAWPGEGGVRGRARRSCPVLRG